MPQQEIEVILMRHLASYLAMPIFVVDPAGTLLFYNEPAEVILGRRFDEAGEMPFEEWSVVFAPHDPDGNPVPPDALPLAVALRQRRAAHGRLRIRRLDGTPAEIEVTAFPLEGQGGRHLGAVAILWETALP
jgi:PAS domain-containing protein